MSRLHTILEKYWYNRPLRFKLQILIASLMVLSLLGSLFTFLTSTMLTQTRLLRDQALVEGEQLATSLATRVENLEAAALLLANDPQVSNALRQAEGEDVPRMLSARAVTVRDRFKIGLIQIYDAEGHARTNLLLSTLYRETSLLPQLATSKTTILYVEERAILATKAAIPDGLGTVLVGIDLETELEELSNRYRLVADVGMRIYKPNDRPTIEVSLTDAFPFTATPGRSQGRYLTLYSLTLANHDAELILLRSTEDIEHITRSGILAMGVSTTLTTASLLVLSMLMLRAVVDPIQQLSNTADVIAHGDLSRRAEVTNNTILNVGMGDEIGVLTDSFNHMVDQLEDLYANLESRVGARTRELAIAAEVARTVSSSLDRDVILRQVAQLIRRRLTCSHLGIYLIEEEEMVARLVEYHGVTPPLPKGESVTLDSHTLMGAAARQHSPCLVEDTHEQSRYLPTTWAQGMRSILAVPLLVGESVIGVMELQCDKPNAFSPEIVALLNTLADQIAIGLQNAQRYSEERKRRRFTEVLELTGRILTGNLDLDQLPGRALSSLRALISYERGALWMKQEGRFVPLAQYGYADERPMHRQRLNEKSLVYQRLVMEHQPVLLDDVAREPPSRHHPWLPGDHTWLGIPIITTKGEVIGVVGMASSEIAAFNEEDIIWAQAFASQAGIALENASLYAEIAAYQQITETELAM